MAKDWGFILQGYIRVDIYKKKTENRIQETEYRRQKKELRRSAVGGQRSFTRNIGMMEECKKRRQHTEDRRRNEKPVTRDK